MKRPRGYAIQAGYVGFMPDGRWMLFSTDKDYEEYFQANFVNEEGEVA